jgi:hypothetical protein
MDSFVCLPHMLVWKLLVAKLAGVKILAKVNVPVHSHIVAGCVVLSTFYTDITWECTGTFTLARIFTPASFATRSFHTSMCGRHTKESIPGKGRLNVQLVQKILQTGAITILTRKSASDYSSKHLEPLPLCNHKSKYFFINRYWSSTSGLDTHQQIHWLIKPSRLSTRFILMYIYTNTRHSGQKPPYFYKHCKQLGITIRLRELMLQILKGCIKAFLWSH